MLYHAEPNRSEPNHWQTLSYTIRRPGETAWVHGIRDRNEARREKDAANKVARGHRIYAEQRYVGDLESLQGEIRTVEVG